VRYIAAMPYAMKTAPNADPKTLSDFFELNTVVGEDGKPKQVPSTRLRKRDVHDKGITVARFGSVVGIVVPREDGSVFVVETSLKLLGDAVDRMRAAQDAERATSASPAE
jgi:hypothetical protein